MFETADEFLKATEGNIVTEPTDDDMQVEDGSTLVRDLHMPDVTPDHLAGGGVLASLLGIAAASSDYRVQVAAIAAVGVLGAAMLWYGGRLRAERHATVRTEMDAAARVATGDLFMGGVEE